MTSQPAKPALERVENRESLPVRTVEAGDVLEGVQLCPAGDWENAGKMQHCTEEALQGVCNRWRADGSPEILVDFEHQAEAGGTSDTSAAAWATNLRVEPGKGLVADFRLTDLGAEAISNRRLRFLSVAWLVDKQTREPVELRSIALTNKPNIPVEPILNREEKKDEGPERFSTHDLQDSQDSIGSDNPANPVNDVSQTEKRTGKRDEDSSLSTLNKDNPQPKEPNMDQLKSLLGLAPDATEEDVSAAVKALKTRLDELEAAAADAEAETFAETNKAKADKAVLKAQYLANKDVARAIVEAIPAPKAPETPAEPQQILNKAGAKTPERSPLEKLSNCKTPEERVAYMAAHRGEFAETV